MQPQGQWTFSVKEAYDSKWVVIGWDDLVNRLKEMNLADAMTRALKK